MTDDDINLRLAHRHGAAWDRIDEHDPIATRWVLVGLAVFWVGLGLAIAALVGWGK